MPTLEQFIRFLKDNDVFKQYINNLKKQHPQYVGKGGFTKDFLELLKDRKRGIIDWSLTWDITKEGYNFWDAMDSKFKKQR